MHATLFLTLLLSLAVDPGTISSPVGTGQPGFSGDGGPASEAMLNNPFDVAFDSAGNLYLSDTFNQRIRRVDAKTGLITTIAGSGRKGFAGDGGPALDAELNEPYGIVLDDQNNLYFADRLNRRVRRVDGKSGLISTVAGNGSTTDSGDGGPAQKAGIVEPNSVALDGKGNLYIADVAGCRIRVVDLKTGLISTFAGTGKRVHDGDGGAANQASIFGARAVEVAPDGTVYILEREGNTLRAVDPDSKTIRTLAGTGQKGFTGDGGSPLNATFNGPKELALDPSDGSILIVDTENHAIRKITLSPQSGAPVLHTIAGDGTPGGTGDGGPATRARLDRPHGVAVGPDGTVAIGDTQNHRIRRLSPTEPKR